MSYTNQDNYSIIHMKTSALKLWDNFRKLPLNAKMVAIALTMVLTAIGVALIPTGHSRKVPTVATVIGKAQTTVQERARPRTQFLLAVRHSDGTLQDVSVKHSTYVATAVGSALELQASPADRGVSPPPMETARGWFSSILFFCGILGFIYVITDGTRAYNTRVSC